MKGQVLEFSIQRGSGVIAAEDGQRYEFAGSEWKGEGVPGQGAGVDFQVRDGKAAAVYRTAPAAGGKNKVAAGLFALLLGGFGIHKFYLGYIGPGLVFLLVNTIGWVITAFMFGIPNIILGIIAFIEGIIYLTKTDEEFERTYVTHQKPWF